MGAVTTGSIIGHDDGHHNDPVEVKVRPAVSFPMTLADEEPATVIPAPVGTVKVRVNAPYRVVVKGVPYVGGDVVNAPASEVDHWIRSGWVRVVASSSRKKASK